jgi:hypothetical protein
MKASTLCNICFGGALTVLLLLAITSPANAYIDGGTGSYMIQMAAAGVMAVLFTLKLSWQRLKAYTAKLFTGNGPRPHGGA